MRRHTNRALLLSFALHIGLMLAVSPFLVNHFTLEKESISAEILEPEAEKQVRRRVLPPRTPLVPQASEAEASPSSPASPTYAPEVSVPEAPLHADVAPDIVTHTDLPQTDSPSPVSNASFGEDDGTLAGPVVIEGQRGGGVGGPGREGRGSGGYGTGKGFVHGTGAADVGLGNLDGVGAGLGIFGTNVMPGHGLIGEVYVPGGTIHQMPDFDLLTPVYTFVTPNLDVPERRYTEGFPTPETQSVVEDFAIRFRGELAIDTPGRYTFGLYADDGAKLYVDGRLVVDNDGIHPARGKQGYITLTAGIYPVEIHYFQGPRQFIALQWYYQPPKEPVSEWSRSSISVTTPKWNWRWESTQSGKIVPPEIIYRPGKPRIPDALRKLQQRLEDIDSEQ
ncbi:MAG: PA14 domain-containing protein [Candidatus Poribacteria bacterium]|nr:PA14 domain-containing protein [Candidatus Poribacteria bacterium]